ncbi:Muniscin C-terminal mu homology domain-containing protein [Bisporella sp. PMI_857]|nr:Muniscin C-terminal mu homology domain-containing protein [Bisporella sp. PMI_857]
MELSRKDYPAMLERRKIEEEYVTKMKKLARRPLPSQEGPGASILGTFDGAWKKLQTATDQIAAAHQNFAQQLEKNVEQDLRNFAANSPEFSGMNTLQTNLGNIAKELEDAEDKSAKLSKKGGKASSAKVDVAAKNLSNATGQWQAQAPFMFEKLQLIDETRLNHLRDIFTQYQTLQIDKVEAEQSSVQEALNFILEFDTALEIQSWASATVHGKSINERAARLLSNAGSSGTTTLEPPSPARRSSHTEKSDRTSEQSNRPSAPSGLKRLGTMLGGGRRRQSIHGSGFTRAASPSKEGRFPGMGAFARTSSRDGVPSPSPRSSSNNLRGSPAPENRLSALAESPTSPARTNGFAPPATISEASPAGPNGTTSGSIDLSDVQPPPGPPPSHLKTEDRKDSEGFTVPAAMNDPISQAQLEAQENDQPQFKLDIRNEPIPEQDADAAAALSAVTNTLRSGPAVTPSRKVGTVRGRRDVRNTIYAPSGSLDMATSEYPLPPQSIAFSRAQTLSSLSGNSFAPPASDTTSIRSGHSLTNTVLAKHADMHSPGLNASIIETLNATFENGEIKTAKISGEVALIFNHSGDEASQTETETIRINNFPNLEAIGPNRTFMHQISEESSDEYKVDISAISPKSATAFTYKVHIDEDKLASQGPLTLRSAWKRQGDNLGLIIYYSLNSAYASEAVLHNLIILAFSDGPKAAGCQAKPSPTFYKEKSLVVWQLGTVTLKPEQQKIVCKLSGAADATPEPGHIEARWEIQSTNGNPLGSGISLSRLQPGKGKEKEKEPSDDPFADDSVSSAVTGTWVEIETSKKLVAGKYEAR